MTCGLLSKAHRIWGFCSPSLCYSLCCEDRVCKVEAGEGRRFVP